MLSEGGEVVSRWANTQPLYFYPYSWLDYLNRGKPAELYIAEASAVQAIEAIKQLRVCKVHFEKLDAKSIQFAKTMGHKTSLICDLEEITAEDIPILAGMDFVRVRVRGNPNLSLLRKLPNKSLLSCIKIYAGEKHNYREIAKQVREAGFDMLWVSKSLETCENTPLSEEEQRRIMCLKEAEAPDFSVVLPSDLRYCHAKRFRINGAFGNSRDCLFSGYRRVLKGDKFYPCYTGVVLASDEFGSKSMDEIKHGKNKCTDCACIYENDMLADIMAKSKRVKNPRFAMEYKDDS
ncbi:MAG: hypothetical protein MUF61_01125 [archaeon]|nr:hypothetical protein [archaeon]